MLMIWYVWLCDKEIGKMFGVWKKTRETSSVKRFIIVKGCWDMIRRYGYTMMIIYLNNILVLHLSFHLLLCMYGALLLPHKKKGNCMGFHWFLLTWSVHMRLCMNGHFTVNVREKQSQQQDHHLNWSGIWT